MATPVGPITASPGLPGGVSASLNVTAAGVVKPTAGVLARILVNAPGSAGNLTLNDVATTGAAAAANQILTIAFGSLTVGQVISLEWPCGTGIVVSSVPTGGAVSISFS